MSLIELLSIGSDLAIVFLLAVQSYVLWVLKKPILETAKNSVMFKKIVKTFASEKDLAYPPHLTQAGIKNCKSYTQFDHVHSPECY